jgi:hypothetical protein
MAIFIVAIVAQTPAVGVNVKVCVPTVEVEIVVGFHVPLIAGVLVDVVGKVGAVELIQSGPI